MADRLLYGPYASAPNPGAQMHRGWACGCFPGVHGAPFAFPLLWPPGPATGFQRALFTPLPGGGMRRHFRRSVIAHSVSHTDSEA